MNGDVIIHTWRVFEFVFGALNVIGTMMAMDIKDG
jgi:hypothetical protein